MCNACYEPLMKSTSPTDRRMAVLVLYRRWRHKLIRYMAPSSVLAILKRPGPHPDGRGSAHPIATSTLGLRPGDWVQVRSEEEIEATLNRKRRYKGLYFMPEMSKFYGQRYRVEKVIHRMLLESTGEMRVMKSPGVYLEGVYCNGEFHDGCERNCFLLWKEEWLMRASGPND